MPGAAGSDVDGSQSGFSISRSSLLSGEDSGGPHGQEEGLTEERALSHGIMGVMYTVCKEKAKYGYLFIAFRLLVDWLQLWLLVVQPPQFDLPPNKLWWQIISFISLNQFMAARGYTFFIVCFYLLVAGLVLAVGLSVWVGWSFQQNRFDHVWPIVILRWFSKVFFQVLDIMSLSLFLMALDCQMFGRPHDIIGYNQEFPDVYCWGMPHMLHVFVAVVSIVVLIAMAGAFNVGEMELDFTTRNQLAIMHTGVELWTFTIRVLMTFVSVFVYLPKWASVAQLVLSCSLTWLMWYWQPQLQGWVNHMRTGTYASVAWCSLLFVVSAFNLGWDASDPQATLRSVKSLTSAMWATTIPIGCFGAYLSWLRLRYFKIAILSKFREELPTDSEDAYEFPDSRFAEVLARCCRCWVGKATLELTSVQLAHNVLKAGLVQLPKDPFMVILHSSFLMDVQSSYQSGYAQLQTAKKLDTGFLMKFAIFSREQQHAQRSVKSGNQQAVDLVSYVEFQRNYRLVLKVHQEALFNIQRFWECLQHNNVKFRNLSGIVQAMDVSVKQAERVYKQVLERHATSVKIVRLYAKFLEDIKQNPWASASWYSQAEQLENTEEDMKQQDTLGDVNLKDPTLQAAISGDNDKLAIIIINAQSVIQMASSGVRALLGYSRAELLGKPLKTLLPPQVADNHASYVRNYVLNGQAKVLNHRRQVVVQKDKQMLPVWITVSRIKGIGEDSVFMGVMEPMDLPKDEAVAWVLQDGSVLTASDAFTDWLGFTVKDIMGQPFTALVMDGLHGVEEALEAARAAAPSQHPEPEQVHAGPHERRLSLALTESATVPLMLHDNHRQQSFLRYLETHERQGRWSVRAVSLAHKYASPVACSLSVVNGGMGAFQFHVVAMKKLQEPGMQPMPMHPPCERAASLPHAGLARAPSMPAVVGSGTHLTTHLATLSAQLLQQDLMIVVDAKGQICHITAAMLELLGHKHPGAQGPGLGGAPGPLGSRAALGSGRLITLDQLMVRPFGHHHQPLLHGAPPVSVPPHSCRSGLSVLLQASVPQGLPVPRPFSLSVVHKKTAGCGHTGHPVHVMLLQPRTMEQALDERRLLLEVNDRGVVTQASRGTPATLLGCAPEQLLGQHVASFLDVLRPPGAAAGAPLDDAEQQHAFLVLLQMVKPALRSSSTSWRVGFLPPPAAADYGDLEAVMGTMSPLAQALAQMVSEARPVVMSLKVKIGSGAKPAMAPGSISIQMELWRADLVTSVLEVSKEGTIEPCESKEVSLLYPAELLLGTSQDAMQDAHIATFLPALAARPLTDLMVPGAFGGGPAAAGAGGNGGGRGQGKKSAIKQHAARAEHTVGPAHLLSVPHAADRAELQVSVQAIRKSGGHHGFYLLLHAVKPSCGRPDFGAWILSGGPALPLAAAAPRPPPLAPPGMALGSLTSPPLVRLNPRLSSVGPLKLRSSRQQGVPEQGATGGPSRYSMEQGVAGGPTRYSMEQPGTPPSGHGSSEHTGQLQGPTSCRDPAVLGLLGEEDDSAVVEAVGPEVEGGADLHVSLVSAAAEEGPRGSGDVKEKALLPQTSDRLASWLIGAGPRQGEDANSMSMSASDTSDDEPESEEPADSEEVKDVPDDAVDAVDESDYKRGQRFKKLYAVLCNALVQRPILTYRKHAYLCVLCVLVIQVAAFVLMYLLLVQVEDLVNDLMFIGEAGVQAAVIATYTRTINMIYAQMCVPTLRLMTRPEDLPYLKQLQHQALENFNDLHAGAYMGYRKPRRLPDVGGLRELWEQPVLEVTNFIDVQFNQSLGNFTLMRQDQVVHHENFWQVGNTLVEKGADLLLNADAINASANGSLTMFAMHPDVMWIINNTQDVVFPGYQQTLDAYLTVVIDSATSVGRVQLILLVLEGVVACGALTTWMLFLLQRVAQLRMSVFNIFMLVPIALVRRMAARRYVLAENEEDEEPRPDAALATQATSTGQAAPDAASKQGPSFQTDPKSNQAKVSVNVKAPAPGPAAAGAAGQTEGAGPPTVTLLDRLKTFLSFGRAAKPATKRKLLPCPRTTIWLVWPFLLWGLINIVFNSVAYMLLKATTAPVAMFILTNNINMLYNQNIFHLQELTYEPDYRMMDYRRSFIVNLTKTFRDEYNIMLFGKQVAKDRSNPRYALLAQGLAYSGGDGANLLFRTHECLCLNETECAHPGDHLYADTHGGLDKMLLKYIEVGMSVQQFQFLDPYLNGPEYDYYWNTQPDISGGLSQLKASYKTFVTDRIKSVSTLQVVMLVLTLLLMLGFVLAMLRPFLALSQNETRRAAELLSQLPPEVDMVGLAQATLIILEPGDKPPAPPTAGPPPALESRAAFDAKSAKDPVKRASSKLANSMV